jgi:hypothetical protein
MPISAEQLVQQIHDCPQRLVLAVTGGGSRAIAELLQVPGASRTVLEARVPYATAAMIDFLGARPEQFCAPRTARLMAMAAWQRARALTAEEPDASVQNLVGVGCTASLASDRPKRGAHRAFVALQTSARTATWSVEFEAGRRGRLEEEIATARLLLNAIADASGLSERVDLGLAKTERLEQSSCDAPADWQQLLLGKRKALRLPQAETRDAQRPRGIFPGSFNPLHEGHRQMAEIASRRLGHPVEFEISVANVDKPPLDFEEMRFRAVQFSDRAPLWFTVAPTFVEKANLFPGATFIVGADTIQRIAEPRYYGGSQQRCRAAIGSLAAQGCRFLVFARASDGSLQTLSDLPLPKELGRLCDEVSTNEFQNDLSSTALRKQRS